MRANTSISEERIAVARDLCGHGCGCDNDATEGCPNWNGERCTWQEHSIAYALAAAEARGRIEGLRESRRIVREGWDRTGSALPGLSAIDARIATLTKETGT